MNFDRIILCTNAPKGQGLAHYYYNALCDIVGSEKVIIIDEGQRNYGAGIIERGWRRIKRAIGHLSRLKYNNILSQLVNGKTNLVILFNNSDFRPYEIKLLADYHSVFLVNYLSDSPFGMIGKQQKEVFDCLAYFDFVFIFAKALIPVLYQMGARNVARVPFGYCTYTHLQPTQYVQVTYPQSLFYFGTWTPGIEKWLIYLVDFELEIEGNGWHQASNPKLRAIGTKKKPHTDQNMAIMARKAGLVVNFTRAPHGCFHTMKTFELPVVGACVLSNYSDEQNEFFPHCQSMVYFNTPEEMVAKVKHFFNHPNEAEKIREQAIRDALPHSYHDRAKHLLNILNNYTP